MEWKDPLGEGLATHSNILAWRIPWTEEPGGRAEFRKGHEECAGGAEERGTQAEKAVALGGLRVTKGCVGPREELWDWPALVHVNEAF